MKLSTNIQCPAVTKSVLQIWKKNRCIKQSSVQIYLYWVQRFLTYCDNKNLDPIEQLTLAGVNSFARWYSRSRGIATQPAIDSSRSALGSWANALQILGFSLPQWKPIRSLKLRSIVLKEFAEYLRVHRGNPEITIHKKVTHIKGFITFLHSRQRRLERLRLQDIDDYIILYSKRFAPATVADCCSSLRRFCRFLLFSQRLSVDLATSIGSPKRVKHETPHRTLPWDALRSLLESIDRQTRCGRRDYALLLLMSTYGLGAGEVIHLTLDDINWQSAIIHVVRPKTGVAFQLPLLPVAAKALVDYLRHGRPKHTLTRHLFVTMKAPYKPLACSVTIRHILHKHAKSVGLDTDHLGTHTLRFTHAREQMELGTSPKVIGDILGHRDPDSTSAYLRVSIERLRDLALPVPL